MRSEADKFSTVLGPDRGGAETSGEDPRDAVRYAYSHTRVVVEDAAAFLTHLGIAPQHIISVTPVVAGGRQGSYTGVHELDIIHLARPVEEASWPGAAEDRKQDRKQSAIQALAAAAKP